MPLTVGTCLDAYEITATLGAGGPSLARAMNTGASCGGVSVANGSHA